MSSTTTLYGFSIGANKDTANWVNRQHQENTKSFIKKGVEIGKVLLQAQKSNDLKFVGWLKSNVEFSIQTAYNYISLFEYRDQLSSAKNITEAYRMIESLEAQKKQSEKKKAQQRVKEYLKTGVKPEGWRRGTDDKLAKEEADRDARVEASKGAEQKKKEQAAREKAEREAEREKERRREKAETDGLLHFLDQSAKEHEKRSAFKEQIRLSAEGGKGGFIDAFIDYLSGLENDSRRIEACHDMIKTCKRIAADLQGAA